MTQLRRLVWRYKAGYYLREQLRDSFLEEAERLRIRSRELANLLNDCGAVDAAKERHLAELERALSDGTRSARSALFDDALRTLKAATSSLATLMQMWQAHAAIIDAQKRLFEIHEFGSFPTVSDLQVLMRRAMQFFDTEQYRTARFIAEETTRAVVRLIAPAKAGECVSPSLAAGLERQELFAASLDSLGIAAPERDRIRRVIEMLHENISSRRFEFAERLLGDLEAENAGIEMFLAQAAVREKDFTSAAAQQAILLLRAPNSEGNFEWRQAAELLITECFQDSSKRLAQHAAAAGR